MTQHATRTLTLVALTALAAGLPGCVATTAAPPAAASAPVATAAPVETPVQRGAYLVLAGGCDDCHTPGVLFGQPDMKRRLSGSELGWAGPWGVSYARNLTSDPETGLGKWTEDQLFHALKHGVRPDGSVLLPPMPWQRMTSMKDEDVRAIAAYLKTLPPVAHRMPAALPPGSPVPPSTVAFPPPPAWDVPPASAAAAAQ